MYEVLRPLQVAAGSIELGFERPGGGVQYIAVLENENPAKEEIQNWFQAGWLRKRLKDASLFIPVLEKKNMPTLILIYIFSS